jgi:AcrR family transcriptional regulator
MAQKDQGRPQQRLRTRKDLLQAAARLMQQGRKPTLDEIAAEAMVSRATAYRYFPDAGALLAEASLDLEVPAPERMFGGTAPQDPVARLEKVDDVLHEAVTSHESQMRIMLAHSVMRAVEAGTGENTPARQNRRMPLITAALAPARSQFTPAALRNLEQALALIIGTEGVIVTRDVLRIDDEQARRVKHWAIRALVEAARKPKGGRG